MAKHARRRRGTVARRVTVPLATLGLGLAPLGVGAGALTATAAPAAPDAPAETGSGEASSAPCAKTVKACVDLSSQKVWITDGEGKVLRGPMHMNHGAKKYPTPTGDFTVQRKERYHVSREFEGRNMPYSVFFDGDGDAFHQGDPDRESAGCVRMDDGDAKFVFEHLDVGDKVEIQR